MLDLFCGRWGWSKGFLALGWECVGVDLVEPPEVPEGCRFVAHNVLDLYLGYNGLTIHRRDVGSDCVLGYFDFICASSPCEQFALFGLRNFHPNPPYPEAGIRLFNHARGLCEASGVLYIMENVRSAEQFVGRAVARCGPFAVWGNGVPPILPQGIKKGVSIGSGAAVKGMSAEQKKQYRKQFAALQMGSKSADRKAETANWATIPPELSHAVASYATRLLELPTSKPQIPGREEGA